MTGGGLTFGQVAQRLGCDVNVVRRWARTEQCPTVRDGRRVRIPAAWVTEQIEIETRATHS